MELVDKLWAIEEIKQLKARYFRHADTRDPALADLFTEDCVFRYADGPEDILVGHDAIRKFSKASQSTSISIHHGHTPEIEILDDTNARGIWAMFGWTRWQSRDGTAVSMQNFGHYHEEYRKESDGRWRISRIRLTKVVRFTADPEGIKSHMGNVDAPTFNSL